MLTIPSHCKINRSTLGRTDGAASAGVRTDGHEHVGSDPGAEALAAGVAREAVDVAAAEGHRAHPPPRHLPPGHQAREHPHPRRHPQARRLRLVPRQVLLTPAHGVDQHEVVAGAGVSADGRVLGLEDGHLGRGLRVLRGAVPVPALPGQQRDRPGQQDPQHPGHAQRHGAAPLQGPRQPHGLQLPRQGRHRPPQPNDPRQRGVHRLHLPPLGLGPRGASDGRPGTEGPLLLGAEGDGQADELAAEPFAAGPRGREDGGRRGEPLAAAEGGSEGQAGQQAAEDRAAAEGRERRRVGHGEPGEQQHQPAQNQ